MDCIYLPGFVKKLKKYAKKYPSLKAELEILLAQLQVNPKMGNPLGKECYKIRLAIKSKGKSGGMRLITCVKIINEVIYFLTIYDKSEQESVSDTDLKVFIEYIKESK